MEQDRPVARSMKALDAIVARFVGALGTAAGYATILMTLVIGFALGVLTGFGEFWSLFFTMYLSLAAILITGAILTVQKRDTAAIQAKLDEIILTISADRHLMGIERQSTEEIDTLRDHLHGEAVANTPVLEPEPTSTPTSS